MDKAEDVLVERFQIGRPKSRWRPVSRLSRLKLVVCDYFTVRVDADAMSAPGPSADFLSCPLNGRSWGEKRTCGGRGG